MKNLSVGERTRRPGGRPLGGVLQSAGAALRPIRHRLIRGATDIACK